MDTYETLIEVLNIIEENKFDTLTISNIARAVYLSASYLQRLFRLAIGQSLMDYARGRKLAHSLRALQNSHMRIIDIAAEYGFAHEQSYIRAFTREFGCTPGRAREEKSILPIRRRIAPEELWDLEQGVLFGPEIVEVPTLHVVGRMHSLKDFDLDRDAMVPSRFGEDFMINDAAYIDNAARASVYHALCIWGPSGDEIRYMPCVQVHDLTRVPEHLTGMTVPSFQGALFRYTGKHGYLDINPITAREIFVARDQFFTNQTRYVAQGPIFQLERIDPRLHDGVYCHFEMIANMRDTLVPHMDTIGS